MSFHPLFAEPVQMGQTLLAMGVKSATFVDECSGDIYIYHSISEHEFQFGRQGDIMTNYDLSPADTGVVCQWCGRQGGDPACGHCVDVEPACTYSVLYIGHDYYFNSGTAMGSLYTEELLHRSDWGKITQHLDEKNHVHIRPATVQELGYFDDMLERIVHNEE